MVFSFLFGNYPIYFSKFNIYLWVNALDITAVKYGVFCGNCSAYQCNLCIGNFSESFVHKSKTSDTGAGIAPGRSRGHG